MLVKLLKYDFKAIGRIFFPSALAYVLSCILTGFLVQVDSSRTTAWETLFVMILILGALVLFVVLYVACLFVFQKTMLMKEGYLTHSLPVHTWLIFLSKMIAIFCLYILYMVIVSLVVCAGLIVVGDLSLSVLLTDLSQPEVAALIPRVIALFLTFSMMVMSYIAFGISLSGIPFMAARPKLKGLIILLAVGLPWITFKVQNTLASGGINVFRMGEQGTVTISLDNVFGSNIYTSSFAFGLLGVIFCLLSVYVLQNHRYVAGE